MLSSVDLEVITSVLARSGGDVILGRGCPLVICTTRVRGPTLLHITGLVRVARACKVALRPIQERLTERLHD